jgi:benzoylformate decarboxylase
VRQKLERFDVALVVGMDLLRSYIYQEPARAIPEGLRLIQLDENPWQLGKTYPVDIGLIGDTQAGLAELCTMVGQVQAPGAKARASGHLEQCRRKKNSQRAELESRIEREYPSTPMTSLAVMGALARVLPSNAAVVEEAVTTTNGVFERLAAIQDPAAYFSQRGWALGWGLGCALGVKLAWADRPVLAILGDGAAVYGIQGLWSAAHYQIPVTFVIANNRQYQILKHCAAVMPLPQMAAGNYVGMDLVRPEVDFVGLARALGVDAERVTDTYSLSERVRESWRGNKPVVLEVLVT